MDYESIPEEKLNVQHGKTAFLESCNQDDVGGRTNSSFSFRFVTKNYEDFR